VEPVVAPVVEPAAESAPPPQQPESPEIGTSPWFTTISPIHKPIHKRASGGSGGEASGAKRRILSGIGGVELEARMIGLEEGLKEVKEGLKEMKEEVGEMNKQMREFPEIIKNMFEAVVYNK